MWRGTGSCQRVNIRATQAQTSAEKFPPHSREKETAMGRAYLQLAGPIGVRLQLIVGTEIVVAGFY